MTVQIFLTIHEVIPTKKCAIHFFLVLRARPTHPTAHTRVHVYILKERDKGLGGGSGNMRSLVVQAV